MFTTTAGAPNLGPGATGLRPFEYAEVGDVRVTAVPALHGPPEIGVVNGPVIGFVLEATGWPTVYVSGDNASLDVVAVVAEQSPWSGTATTTVTMNPADVSACSAASVSPLRRSA
ncbi:hypothetical protein [Micromonospora sp. NPDC005324]|uniref:MBL fold metallo-hydrolase n=1 Tax=Micromonospora sp. NPDC005324 TaxID=3157033 RepID=UPI0033A541E1